MNEIKVSEKDLRLPVFRKRGTFIMEEVIYKKIKLLITGANGQLGRCPAGFNKDIPELLISIFKNLQGTRCHQ